MKKKKEAEKEPEKIDTETSPESADDIKKNVEDKNEEIKVHEEEKDNKVDQEGLCAT
jgi:hypothetical protein